MPIAFGEALRSYREAAGKTLAELAKPLGVSIPYLSDVERGKRAPFGQRERLAIAEDELGLEPGTLVGHAAGDRTTIDVADLTPSERRRVASFAQKVRAERAA